MIITIHLISLGLSAMYWTQVKMKVRGVMARKGYILEYVRRMQLELFEYLSKVRNREELRSIESKA